MLVLILRFFFEFDEPRNPLSFIYKKKMHAHQL